MAPFTSVSRLASLVAALMVAEFCLPMVASAQSPTSPMPPTGAEVEVRSVKFANVRAPGSGAIWLEATVEVGVAASPAGGAASRFADRVQITLSLSLGTQDTGFFRATAEAVSLETGRAAFRFYLPPEILRRERVNSDPYAYAVDVAVRGRPVPAGAGAVSSVLRSAEVVRSFKDRVAQAAPLNDGVFVPQYLSPFAATYAADTPSFVRHER